MMAGTGSKLDAVVEEFAGLEPRECLELLLDFAENLPALPAEYRAQRDAGLNRVHECQTPVFLWVELHGGRVKLIADVAPEAPTVKGFLAVLVEAFSGATPDEVLSVPPNLIRRLGLVDALGMVRMNGLHAILGRIRREVAKAAGNGEESQSSTVVS